MNLSTLVIIFLFFLGNILPFAFDLSFSPDYSFYIEAFNSPPTGRYEPIFESLILTSRVLFTPLNPFLAYYLLYYFVYNLLFIMSAWFLRGRTLTFILIIFDVVLPLALVQIRQGLALSVFLLFLGPIFSSKYKLSPFIFLSSFIHSAYFPVGIFIYFQNQFSYFSNNFFSKRNFLVLIFTYISFLYILNGWVATALSPVLQSAGPSDLITYYFSYAQSYYSSSTQYPVPIDFIIMSLSRASIAFINYRSSSFKSVASKTFFPYYSCGKTTLSIALALFFAVPTVIAFPFLSRIFGAFNWFADFAICSTASIQHSHISIVRLLNVSFVFLVVCARIISFTKMLALAS